MRFELFQTLEPGVDARGRWVSKPARRLTIRGLMALVLVSALGAPYVVREWRRQAAAKALVAAIPNEVVAEAEWKRVKTVGAEPAVAARLAEVVEADRLARAGLPVPRGDRRRRQMAMAFLRRIGPAADPAVPAMARTLELEPTEIYRGEAAVFFGRLADHDHRAFDASRAALAAPVKAANGDVVRASSWAAFALGMLKSETKKNAAIAGLISVIDQGNPEGRMATVHALGFLGAHSEAANSADQKGLDDPNPANRIESARTLSAFGPLDGPIPDPIARLRDDPDESIRLMANEAELATCRRRVERLNASSASVPTGSAIVSANFRTFPG